MILVKPSYEILSISGADLNVIEQAGRTCYKSESKGEPEVFVQRLIRSGHETVIEHSSMTVKFIVDRGFSHELVRHRLVSFSQESTRYCNYSGGVTFIIPPWVDAEKGEYTLSSRRPIDPTSYQWWTHMLFSEQAYLSLLENDWTPQQARTVLPNSLKTEIIMTANFREWRHVFKLRALGTTGKPHPQMSEIMIPLLEEVKFKIPGVFDDLG